MTKPRCLLISPRFFGYERDIADAISDKGYQVEFIDERPSNSALMRAAVRLRPSLVSQSVDRYFRARLAELRDIKFDIVLVVKGEVVPHWFLMEVREANPAARFLFYAYDSISSSPRFLKLADLFDRLYSFDRGDVESHAALTYLPLFYAKDFEVDRRQDPPKWDFAFIGTLHSGRYRYATNLARNFTRPFLFFYCQARWYFFVTKYVTRENRDVPWGSVSFEPLSRQDVAEVFRCSAAVLDVQRSGQTGLTMRTFEVLASGAQLLTTNSAIEQEPFFDLKHVRVVNELNAIEEASRIPNQSPGPPAEFERYSIACWVEELLA